MRLEKKYMLDKRGTNKKNQIKKRAIDTTKYNHTQYVHQLEEEEEEEEGAKTPKE